MKNSLELQLQTRIRKANKYLNSRQYQKAIKEYSSTLTNYIQNRRYNQTVSQHFQSLIYSLRANAYSLNLQSQLAEQDFYKSLTLNPYNSITLSKRAKHFIKQQKLQQAIQDIDMALLYDPDNISLIALLNIILEQSKELQSDQCHHILELVQLVKKHIQAKEPSSLQKQLTSSSESQQDQEEFLKFSNLKKIDRVSIKVNALKLPKRQSIVQFKEDQIIQYQQNLPQQQATKANTTQQKVDEIIQNQDVELKKLQEQQEKQADTQQKIIIIKCHQKSRKSILRRDSVFKNESSPNSLSFTEPGNKLNSSANMLKLNLSANKINSSDNVLQSNPSQLNKSCSSFQRLSVKNIDGKLITHESQKIKFQHSLSSFGFINNKNDEVDENDDRQQYKLTLTKPKPAKRKSCFRVSKRFSIDEAQELSKTMPNRKSSFLNIKSIDGQYHKRQQNGNEQDEQPIQIKISSDSDDENEHDIFGSKKQKEFIHFISKASISNQSLNQKQELQQSSKPLQLNKKKSILKKDSFLDSPFEGWKSQKKKSVLFKTG